MARSLPRAAGDCRAISSDRAGVDPPHAITQHELVQPHIAEVAHYNLAAAPGALLVQLGLL
ncbi:hypothetical protein [Anaplasma centrale]|uniref:hypothetical protein n=1 Tax=Anaplasma centrale TaxID=769 RepID=UPI001EE5D849|nr:hypothetical protein [Anaplasma centrale]